MSESKFNTTQYQNVIGGGTEEWINMSDSERKALRKGIATNLNIGLTFSPIGGGTAGAINTKLKGIVECTKFYQRDMDVRGLDFELGETPFDKIKEIITSKEGYSCGTGDSFVNKKIDMEVDVVDMEAYAIAKVCKLENIEFKCFKYISDNADENADNDWSKNLAKGASAFTNLINTQF